MADYKYVMFQDERTGRRRPILFPNELVHAEVTDAVIACGLMNSGGSFYRPVAAGFITLAVASTHGRSESLNMASDPDDATRINTHPYTGGIKGGLEHTIEPMLLVKIVEQLLEKVK